MPLEKTECTIDWVKYKAVKSNIAACTGCVASGNDDVSMLLCSKLAICHTWITNPENPEYYIWIKAAQESNQ